MFNELPYYLQTLNTISTTPPSGTNDTENEDAIWKYLNTDDLFQNFGTQPSMFQPKEEIESPIVPSAPADLKSFIEQFAQDVPLPLPLPYNATASSSSAERKPTGVKTLDIMPPLSSTSVAESPSEDGGPSAAKKVKEWGPVMTDIEDE